MLLLPEILALRQVYALWHDIAEKKIMAPIGTVPLFTQRGGELRPMPHAMQHGMGKHLALAGPQHSGGASGELLDAGQVRVSRAGKILAKKSSRPLPNVEQLPH